MTPVLFRLGPLEVGTHDAFVVLGVGVALGVFYLENRRRNLFDPRLWTIAAGALVTGAVFAKLGSGWRYLVDNPEPSLIGLWLHGGKSVLGGLAGAYLGVILTKRLVGYPHKTGDLFAPAVALGIAVGRIGCFLTEPIGTPTSLPWGITVSPEVGARIPNCPQCTTGLPLHPSFLYEIVALVVLYGALRWLRPRVEVPGELFKVFLLGYGAFRFLVEFVRGNETFALGLTGSQIFLLATMPLLVAYFFRQLVRHAYRPSRSRPAAMGTAA
ncbi:MAG: diacylglyceryl transferase [Acidimicrobiia bacterium]|nr:diacylglyceryl transferase [Acidimicrobiia bacterium]